MAGHDDRHPPTRLARRSHLDRTQKASPIPAESFNILKIRLATDPGPTAKQFFGQFPHLSASQPITSTSQLPVQPATGDRPCEPLPWSLCRQLLTAFTPPPPNNRPAMPIRHPGAKAQFSFPLQVGGLISPLHLFSSSFIDYCQARLATAFSTATYVV